MTPRTLLEPLDVSEVLCLSVSRVRTLAIGGKLRVAARTPRGTRLFDPIDVECLRVRRAKGRP